MVLQSIFQRPSNGFCLLLKYVINVCGNYESCQSSGFVPLCPRMKGLREERGIEGGLLGRRKRTVEEVMGRYWELLYLGINCTGPRCLHRAAVTDCTRQQRSMMFHLGIFRTTCFQKRLVLWKQFIWLVSGSSDLFLRGNF